jgi:hypothetical protein
MDGWWMNERKFGGDRRFRERDQDEVRLGGEMRTGSNMKETVKESYPSEKREGG